MNVDTVAAALRRHFRDLGRRYALDGDELRVEPVFNWGGFGSFHFAVGDGRRALHVKLSRDPETIAGLERWRALSPVLEARYRAPAIVDWIRVGELSLEGLLLERSPGRPRDFRQEPELLPEVLSLAERLHHDEELSRVLGERGVGHDARGSVLRHHVEHLEADLAESGDRYPVTAPLLEWMSGEVRALRALIEAEGNFEGVRPVPIHDDLWKDNVLFEPSGEWLVVDWDDLKLGDPILDYATLLWPLLREGADPTRWLGRWARQESFRRRLELCLRAALLDEVVDSLADWVEAEKMPRDVERVRSQKLLVHQRALAEYRCLYLRGISRGARPG